MAAVPGWPAATSAAHMAATCGLADAAFCGHHAAMPNHDHIFQSLKDALQEAETRGYQRGWDECMAAMVAAASKRKNIPTAVSDVPPDGEGETYTVMVMRALTVKPGITAPQIQAWLADKGLPANKIAARSAVRRLLRQGKIEQRGLKFFPKAERLKEVA
jgi:hypothetical protein